MNEEKSTCQSCAYRLTEYLHEIDDDEDVPLIMGLDYRFKCKIHNIVVKPDYWCINFDLPF